ncbi:hypothetical protein Ppa06_57460 [Planomonospora parontospora subsp. parontospora]|uniref:Uncharacterized protein n=2 Tax=Planomonospora parontospora TaxID=58119 RepID=A0AA37BM30_9ACTN|nr:hypothetical protein [Planomonospora parontospora]GGK90833.1 hypothetical protein GCM10010126_57850 [Planomonospora parontospora]GII11948.1 hypothetical protein Ppa06_57460 [Planomonospora parontospora subsp. parontospora]
MKRIIRALPLGAIIAAGSIMISAIPAHAGSRVTNSYSVTTGVVTKSSSLYLSARVANKTKYNTKIGIKQKVCKISCITVSKSVNLAPMGRTAWLVKLGSKGWRAVGNPTVYFTALKPPYTITMKPVFELGYSNGSGDCYGSVNAKGTIRNNTTTTKSYSIEGIVTVGAQMTRSYDFVWDVRPGRTVTVELYGLSDSWCSLPARSSVKIVEVEAS